MFLPYLCEQIRNVVIVTVIIERMRNTEGTQTNTQVHECCNSIETWKHIVHPCQKKKQKNYEQCDYDNFFAFLLSVYKHSITNAMLWLVALLIYSVIDSSLAVWPCKKMTAAAWHFQSVCEEDLDKVMNDK